MDKEKFDKILEASMFEPKKIVMIKHKGIIDLSGFQIPCYVDEEGSRLLSARKMQGALRIIDVTKGGPQKPGTRLDRFLKSPKLSGLKEKLKDKNLDPLIRYDGKVKINGYRAELLVDICDYMLSLRKNNELDPNRHTRLIIIAEQCEILLRSFVKIGIIALIDEATGFQKDRGLDALKILLEQYIEQEARKWIKEFPDQFFHELDRLYENEKTKINK